MAARRTSKKLAATTWAEVRIRRRVVDEFGVYIPGAARALFNWVVSEGKDKTMLSFAVDALPPTLNHMYISIPGAGRRVLTDETKRFREYIALSIGGNRHRWKPAAKVFAMVFMQSPHWITKKNTMRDMDGDNRCKPLFDAIQHAVQVPDYTNWHFYCSKVVGSRIRTIVYLFDDGDVVDCHL